MTNGFSFHVRFLLSHRYILGIVLIALISGCTKDSLDDDLDAYPALPPHASLEFVTLDSAGDWVQLFPDGTSREGILSGYNVDSIMLFDSNQLQLIRERQRSFEGWYFPSVYYTYRRLTWPDTLEWREELLLRMNSTHLDTLQAVIRYKPQPQMRPPLAFDYARFYLNSSLIGSTNKLSIKLFIPI